MVHFNTGMTKKVVMTGGHFTPGYAVFEQFKKLGGWEVFWVGDKAGLEARILPKLDVPFWCISAPKFHRKFPIRSVLGFWKFLAAFFQSFKILLKIRPDALLSLGGYVSLPAVASAWVLRIPVVIHEQTSRAGLANRIAAFFSKFVAVSWEGSRRFFPSDKVYITGNPVREQVWKIARPKGVKKDEGDFVIYITGGSRGAQRVNKVIFEVLPGLLRLGKVYHQTGQLDFDLSLIVKGKLEAGKRMRYLPFTHLSFDEVCEIYKKADLVISRAGANTVSELAIIGVPSILIPIPWSQKNEQLENARGLQRLGNGVVLEEKDLTPSRLLEKVNQMLKKPEKYENKGGDTFLARRDAGKKVVELVERAISGT